MMELSFTPDELKALSLYLLEGMQVHGRAHSVYDKIAEAAEKSSHSRAGAATIKLTFRAHEMRTLGRYLWAGISVLHPWKTGTSTLDYSHPVARKIATALKRAGVTILGLSYP